MEVNAGEMIDRQTILEIKSERLLNRGGLVHMRAELQALLDERAKVGPWPDGVPELAAHLREVNIRLWEVEDALRELELRQDFGPEFVDLARSVYQLNDERGALKRQISEQCGSRWVEQKQYGNP